MLVLVYCFTFNFLRLPCIYVCPKQWWLLFETEYEAYNTETEYEAYNTEPEYEAYNTKPKKAMGVN